MKHFAQTAAVVEKVVRVLSTIIVILCTTIESRAITILLLQQTVRSSCWSSMFNGIWPVPPNKRFKSVYLQNTFLISGKITVIPFD